MAKQVETNVDSFYEALMNSKRTQGVIDRAMAKVEEAKATISGTLFALAKDECQNSLQNFASRCEQAELKYKERTKGANLPKQWTQAKSNIKAALKAELKLTDYDTESKMRAALNKHNKDKRQKSDAEKTQEKIDAMTIGDKLGATIATMLNKLESDGLGQEGFASANDLITELEALAIAPKDVNGDIDGQAKVVGIE